MTDTVPAPTPIRRGKLSSGDAAIDMLLGGGIPRDAVYILSGPPGAGKTILAQQITFSAAKQGLRAIYFTNVSESHAKIVEHIRNFAFYTPNLLGDRISIYNVTSQVRSKGFKETLDFIVETVRKEKADLVVIDSFRGLKHVLDVNVRARGAMFDATTQLSILGCTSILVGEYTPQEIQTEAEFAIADGIINLLHTTVGAQEHRTLNISKMRGVRYLGGDHRFLITDTGLEVYPRQEALSHTPRYQATSEHLSMGLPSLDAMLNGGPIRYSTTLLTGSSGIGKTLLGLHFLAAGAVQGERSLMVSFQENPEQLMLRSAAFSLIDQLKVDAGVTEILFISPVELIVDAAAAQIRAAVINRQVQRVVLDSVAELESALRDPERFDDFLASLIGFLRSHEVTTVMIRELPQLFGQDLTLTARGLSYIVDNIILLRYVEVQAEIRRVLTVIKSRGSDHDKRVRELVISTGDIIVGEQLKNLEGLMSGLPQLINTTLLPPGSATGEG